MIGEPGGGWLVARATLAHERRLADVPGAAVRPGGRAWREAIAERTAAAEPHKWYPQRAGRPDLVIPQAQALGRSGDPVVRQEIARLIELAWSARWMADRAAAIRRPASDQVRKARSASWPAAASPGRPRGFTR